MVPGTERRAGRRALREYKYINFDRYHGDGWQYCIASVDGFHSSELARL